MSDEQPVLAWVRKAPFDDIKLIAAEPHFSYDQWFQQGREIPQCVDILAQILVGEDLSKPSGDGMRIAYALGWIGDRRKAVVAALTHSISSKDTALRMEAVAALGRLREPSAEPLLEKLLDDPREDINVRGNACIALGRLANPASEHRLRHAAQSTDRFLSSCGNEALRLLREAEKDRKP